MERRQKRQRTARRGGPVTIRTGKSQTKAPDSIWPYRNYYKPIFYDPFPYKAHAIMRYSESFTLTPSTGVPAHHLWRANGIFDPNQTGTGHQPYGHDQYAAIYNHYQILESTIVMQCSQANVDCIFGINLIADTSTENDYDTVREVKGCKMSIHQNQQNAGPVTQTFNSRTYPNKNEQSALFGASPADSFYFDTWAEMRNITTSGSGIPFIVTITYKVMMWEPKNLGQS